MDNRGSMLCFSTSHEKTHKFQLIVYHKWCQDSGFGTTCSARSCNSVKTGQKMPLNHPGKNLRYEKGATVRNSFLSGTE